MSSKNSELISRLAGTGLLAALLGAPAVNAQDDVRSAARAEPRNGEAVYEHWCSHCHDAGRGMAGTQSLQVKYKGELPPVLLERQDLTAEAIKTFVRQGVLSMPPFRKTEISDGELDALAAWMIQEMR